MAEGKGEKASKTVAVLREKFEKGATIKQEEERSGHLEGLQNLPEMVSSWCLHSCSRSRWCRVPRSYPVIGSCSGKDNGSTNPPDSKYVIQYLPIVAYPDIPPDGHLRRPWSCIGHHVLYPWSCHLSPRIPCVKIAASWRDRFHRARSHEFLRDHPSWMGMFLVTLANVLGSFVLIAIIIL